MTCPHWTTIVHWRTYSRFRTEKRAPSTRAAGVRLNRSEFMRWIW